MDPHEQIITATNIGKDLLWVAIINAKTNPEGTTICNSCGSSIFMHPNYSKAGISSCVGKARCYDQTEIARKMVEFRGWTFLKLEAIEKRGSKVHFICQNKHEWRMNYDPLKKGAGCRSCFYASRGKPKEIKTKLTKSQCACLGKICVHYSHLADPNGGAEEWDFELNKGTRPETIFPYTENKYWYKCSNKWCLMSYEQTPASRSSQNARCSYCAGLKACQWNCLLTNYPELCEEWDPENSIKPTDIMSGSREKIKWTHNLENGENHKWIAAPLVRCRELSGCPFCKAPGEKQKRGGHDYFVAEANKVHNGKYQYTEQYKGIQTPIEIYCPALDKNGNVHGNFTMSPHHHKAGKGCQKCRQYNRRSKLISSIILVVESLHEDYHLESLFPGLISERALKMDITIPKWNLSIEGDGEQHFRNISSWGGIAAFIGSQKRDLIKDRYFVRNKLNLIRIPYNRSKEEIAYILSGVIQLIRTGHCVYMTYKHYYDEVIKTEDLSSIYVIITPVPLSKNSIDI